METIVNGNSLLFYDTQTKMTTTIGGLKLSKAGVLKEHPDLENNPNWRVVAIERLKRHMNQMGTELKKTNYIKEELKQHGYEPLYYQRSGFRPKKFNE